MKTLPNTLREILTVLLAIICCHFDSMAQPPQAITYQAVARDSSGNILSEQAVSLRFSIHTGTSGGTVVYSETHSAITNALGLFTVSVGLGTIVTGTFTSINWASGNKYLQVELDPTGGTSYLDMGTQQMLSVPYSLYSGSAGGAASGDLSGSYPNPTVLRINGSLLGTTTSAVNGQVLKYNGTSWTPGTDNSSTGTATGDLSGSYPNPTVSRINGSLLGTTTGAVNGQVLKYNGTNWSPGIDNNSTGAASGDLSGSYPNPTVSRINGSLLGTTTGAVNGQVLKYNGTSWSPGTDNNSGTVTSVTAGTGLSGGTITTIGTISMPNTGTAGTYGSASQVPVITTDAQGRVTSVINTTITSSGWGITGNSNIVDGTNFLGTTNAVPFSIRVNNLKSGRIDYDTPYNTFFGYQDGNAITTGQDNTAVGYTALSMATTASQNTAIGQGALLNNVAAWANTAIGWQSQINCRNSASFSQTYNTSIGYSSLSGSVAPANNTGVFNCAIGALTLYVNSTGTSNTADGYQSLTSNTTGSSNVAVGRGSMFSNTIGDENVSIGSLAFYNNVAAVGSVAIGFHSQYNAYNGTTAYVSNNTSVGTNSLQGSNNPANNTGNNNTAIGTSTLGLNTTGSDNCASGYGALNKNSTGNYNSAVGSNTLSNNTTGSDNAAIGYVALQNNASGSRNCGVGTNSLASNAGGNNNVAIGYNSLWLTDASSNNTFVGYASGGQRNHGNSNTYVGYLTFSDNDGYTNSSALGANVQITASNQVRIGSGVTSIGGPQNWSNTSDRRIKLNIREDVKGMAFIRLLKPVTYNKSMALENAITGNANSNTIGPDNDYEKIRYSGFIAQEVEQAAEEAGYDFSGVDAPKTKNDLYTLRYAEFVVPLVKAMQEQQAIIDQQSKLIERVSAENEILKAATLAMDADLQKIKHELGIGVVAKK